MKFSRSLTGLFVALLCALTSCGYHVGGSADMMPKTVRTISIPAFRTNTTRYKLVDMLPQAIGREFITRTRFRLENDPALADAVLNGTIASVVVYPATTDPVSGITTSISVRVVLSVNLIERTTGRVLYSRANWPLIGAYAVAVEPHQFFDESGPAFDRLTQDVARQFVSGVVENF
ncbi:MAG TPA: LPS assembly lipoprotein LptE [Bryobacteraceae bacterium]|nr:LPS assembly lipoprotein LptE [Bryobacteraceae bacterium]